MKTKQYTALYPYTGEVIGTVTARSRPEGYERMQGVLYDGIAVYLAADGITSDLMQRILAAKKGDLP